MLRAQLRTPGQIEKATYYKGECRSLGLVGDVLPGRVQTCAILTTSPSEVVTPVHDRLPIILRREDLDEWLDPDCMMWAGSAS